MRILGMFNYICTALFQLILMNVAQVKSSDRLFLIGITNMMEKKPWSLKVMIEMHSLVR